MNDKSNLKTLVTAPSADLWKICEPISETKISSLQQIHPLTVTLDQMDPIAHVDTRDLSQWLHPSVFIERMMRKEEKKHFTFSISGKKTKQKGKIVVTCTKYQDVNRNPIQVT